MGLPGGRNGSISWIFVFTKNQGPNTESCDRFGHRHPQNSPKMKLFIEKIIASVWNRLRRQVDGEWNPGEQEKRLDLGFRVTDGQITKKHVMLGNIRRAQHTAALGKTGTGKSSLLKYLAMQDIQAGRGFAFFDLHGEMWPFLLATINAQERRLKRHLHNKLIFINPADAELSVGLNPLEMTGTPDFARIAEFADVIRRRCHLDSFGVRIDELLRNSLYVLAANGLTLIELMPLLTRRGFRAACLQRVENADIRDFFESRYDKASDAMQAAMREPVLNKTSAFTSDPRFRHIVGQKQSTFSIREAMDKGCWIVVNLAKGQLGDQALTLGSLVLTLFANALFSRELRTLYTLFCDEIQNLVAYESGVETMLSESRKFAVAIVSANQYLDQYPPAMRSAILSVGTHAYFQLSSADAGQIAQALDGGRMLAEKLKNLHPRHCLVKSGADQLVEVRVPDVPAIAVDYTDLLNRARYERGRVRAHVERDIAKRQSELFHDAKEVLNRHEFD